MNILAMPPGTNPDEVYGPTPPWIKRMIHLYNRCAIFGSELALPCSGGVLDQPESVMQILEVIHRAVQEDRIQRQDDAEFRAKTKDTVNKVKGNTTKRM